MTDPLLNLSRHPALAELQAGTVCRAAVLVPEDSDVAAASRLMRDKHVQYLLVVARSGEHRLVGVVSGYDIAVTAVAYERDPRTLRVGDVMRPPVLLLRADQPARSIPSLLANAGIACAPVLSEDGAVIGILSTEDVIRGISN